MTHGFDLENPLVCEGIVGDGCGGGRIFYIDESALYAYDPAVEESMLLLENLQNAQKLSKDGCLLTILLDDAVMEFDLSSFHTSIQKI
jgi:hypothetical protein